MVKICRELFNGEIILFYHVAVVRRIVYVDFDPESKERGVIRLFMSNKGDWTVKKIEYHPFLLSDKSISHEGIQDVKTVEFSGTQMYLIRVKHRKYLQKVKQLLEEKGGNVYYHDVGAEFQFLLENGILPAGVYFEDLTPAEEDAELLRASIDIEVYSPGRSPDPSKDPIVMASYVDSEGFQRVITTARVEKPFVKVVDREEDIIRELNSIIKERDPDVIYTYFGDRFDLPYLKERAKTLGLELRWGRDGSEVQIHRTAAGSTASIRGRAHVDVYRIAEYMEAIGAINVIKLDLESVYAAITGKEKIDVGEVSTAWEKDKATLAEYNLQDAIACMEIGDKFLDLYIELGNYTLTDLYEAVRLSASQMVENMLIKNAFKRKEIIPRRPKESEVRKRLLETYKGGYVKEPVPGLYENVAVLDFRSLYPTIIITYNVDPSTLNKSCDEFYESPSGHRFCKHPKGLLPSTLDAVLRERYELKDRLKQLKKGTLEYKVTYARQQALKIVANASYGYLAYARARWYCKECAEAITSWARDFIKMVMEEAEMSGLKVLYGDTDSVFVQYREKTQVMKFLEYINNKLPGIMELELEGFYKRALFIKKRRDEGAAKKKYALIDEEGRIKIAGMEYVRRDWSEIARRIQRAVVETILKEGNIEKALRIIKDEIQRTKEGKLEKEELVIYTEIQKPLEEYHQRGPHVEAAKKLLRSGYKVGPGTIVGYIIERGHGSVSERAVPVELYSGEYDIDYYVERQIIPAVLPIFEALGYKEKDLLIPSTQKTLFEF